MNIRERTMRRICRKNYLNLLARIEKLGNSEQKKAKWICTLDEYMEMVSKADTCTYCGIEFRGMEDLEIDHVRAFSKGGHSLVSNLTPSCTFCNRAKGDEPVQIFLIFIERYGTEEYKNYPRYAEFRFATDEHFGVIP